MGLPVVSGRNMLTSTRTAVANSKMQLDVTLPDRGGTSSCDEDLNLNPKTKCAQPKQECNITNRFPFGGYYKSLNL